MTVSVDDAGLLGLERAAHGVADETGRTRGRLPDAGPDLGYIAAVHAAVVSRWGGGLEVAQAAADELAEKIGACRTEYAAVDDDATVTFTGLDR